MGEYVKGSFTLQHINASVMNSSGHWEFMTTGNVLNFA